MNRALMLVDIAATAIEHQLGVFATNVRHFSSVVGLTVEAFAP